jgi:hypothetical protein
VSKIKNEYRYVMLDNYLPPIEGAKDELPASRLVLHYQWRIDRPILIFLFGRSYFEHITEDFGVLREKKAMDPENGHFSLTKRSSFSIDSYL